MRTRLQRGAVTTTLLAALVLGAAVPWALAGSGPIGEWKFDGDLKNAVGTALKMAQLEPVGTNTFQVVDVAGTMKQALVFPQGNGLTLTRIPDAASSTYSVDVYFEFDATSSYRRIMSFGPNTVDKGLYLYDGIVELYPQKEGTTAIAVDTWTHVAITRDGKSGKVVVYVDGVPEISYKDSHNKYLLKKGKIVFFVDDGSENASGTVSNIRVYDRVIIPV